MTDRRRVDAVVFDLLFTLVHPGAYPNGTDRAGWLADIIGVDRDAVAQRWAKFESVLEAGQAPSGTDGTSPELVWVERTAAEFGRALSEADLALVAAEWDLTRRAALLNPPPETLDTLQALRAVGLPIGVLSNTHALESRAWPESPLAGLVDAVVMSHQAGAMKPHRAAYDRVLVELKVSADRAAYVGDGGGNELAGARGAGFAVVVLAEEASRRWAPADLPRLRAQADASVSSLRGLLPLFRH